MADWLGASFSLPVSDAPFWAVAGGWKRWRPVREGPFAVDASAHAFVQRERQSADPVLFPDAPENSGQGVGGELALVGLASRSQWRGEARLGAVAQMSEVSDVGTSTFFPFGEARVLYELGVAQIGPELRLWLGDSATSYAGASAFAAAGPLDAWVTGGRWLGGSDGTGFAWAAGVGVPIGRDVRIEADYRSSSYDPLYRTGTSSSITLGASVRLSGSTGVAAPVPSHFENGRAIIRLRARDVRGRPSIAGDFNGWKPQPMTPAGGEWTFSVALRPGTYSYAFVDESGEWFVPESTPGRRPDGMGGWQAVLVVS